jgi:glycosyltransferase involved in cell wall biosynthesis
MKKIARMLASSFQNIHGIDAKVVSIHKAIRNIHQADILHYIGGPTYRSVLFAFGCKIRNKEILTLLTFTNPHWNWISDVLIRIFPPDCVIVSSSYWQNWANKIGLPVELMALSGVDLERFVPVSPSEKKNLRQQLGLPLDKLITLHVGHLKEDRNLIELLKAQAHPDIQVVVVGSTTTKQSNMVVNQLETADCIVIRNYQPKIEIFYQSADCYVFPTTNHEAAVQIPLSILEAMATNLPIITTRFGGLQDFFPETHGFSYIMPDEFYNLANIIIKTVLANPSSNSYVQNFSWDQTTKQLLEVYQKLPGVSL